MALIVGSCSARLILFGGTAWNLIPWAVIAPGESAPHRALVQARRDGCWAAAVEPSCRLLSDHQAQIARSAYLRHGNPGHL